MSVTFELADFIPYYVPVNQPSSTIYPSLPNSSPDAFYQSIQAKQEFNTLTLAEEPTPPEPDELYLKHQKFVARFFSPATPYNRLLAVHAVGTGKCVHPYTFVSLAKPFSIFDKSILISQLWHTQVQNNMIVTDQDKGEWIILKDPIHVHSFNPKSKIIETKPIARLYREYVNTTIYKYTTDQSYLVCTAAHQIYTTKGFKSSIPLQSQLMHMHQKNLSTSFSELKHIHPFHYQGYVYDLEVQDTHTYIANGFVTHNTCLLTAVAEKAKEVNPSIPRVIIITLPGKLQDQTAQEIAGTCSGYKYEPKSDLNLKLDDSIIKRRRNEALHKNRYQITTLYEFIKQLREEQLVVYKDNKTIAVNTEEIHRQYDGSYMIIDEAHKIVPDEKTTSGYENYQSLLALIHNIQGLKLLLLTATPMINSAFEIVGLLNMLLPKDQQIKERSKAAFLSKWFDTNDTLKSPDSFVRKFLIGKISYLKSKLDIDIEYVGSPLPERNIKFINVVPLLMDPFQREICKRIFKEECTSKTKSTSELVDEKEESSCGIATNSKQASSFIYPDGTFRKEGEDRWLRIVKEESSSDTKIQSYQCNADFKKYLRANGSDTESMLAQIKKCSVKLEYIIRTILDNPKQKMFIYSNQVIGGGSLLIGSLLQEFGFQPLSHRTKSITPNLPREKRFVIYASALYPYDNVETNILNRMENLYGDYVQVIIGGEQVQVGLNFFHIRHLFIYTPEWNMSTLEQATGRALRYGGHRGLPADQQTIKIHRLCAQTHPIDKPGNPDQPGNPDKPGSTEMIESIDEIFYRLCEQKDIKIKQIEHLLKLSAMDCSNNKLQNYNPKNVSGSRECEYTDCNYTCYFTSNEQTPISDTYNIYYGEQETKSVTKLVQKMFNRKFSYDFTELLFEIRNSTEDLKLRYLSSILLARSLYKIIVNNEIIINRFGFPNYLREDRNLYFLTDDPSRSAIYTLGWYSSHPNPNDQLSYDESLNVFYDRQTSVILRQLEEVVVDEERIKTILSNAPTIISQSLIEISFLRIANGETIESSPLNQAIQKIYSKYIISTPTFITHHLFGQPRYISLASGSPQWKTISLQEYTSLKQYKPQEFIINEDLAQQIGIEGSIPSDYTDKNKFQNLKIKVHRIQRELDKGGFDNRQSRGGTRCSTDKDFTKEGLLRLMVDLVRLSQQYNLIMPLDYITQKSDNLKTRYEFLKTMSPAIARWDIYHRIANYLKDTNQVLDILFPLKSTIPQKVTRETFCAGLRLSKEDCKVTELSQSEIAKILPQYTIPQIVRVLKVYSDNLDILKKLYKELFAKDYTSQDLSSQYDPQLMEILSKVVDLPTSAICQGVGKWFEANSLLGMY